ncbi:hypothetical protein BOTBODRAFT_480760 [Botryobasidium botryosum FD-172 SS1]|uniref:Uncharacterized protein n=1 Tax=Botryobasidium botryosum (strain FD-172 SS1) TaxID=930990 RepID=A0A067MTR0_BOTB1|nr:hypothetical protein BOTBODRAFT_480760 [Botryobasidium botryosum FD-172 SS1]
MAEWKQDTIRTIAEVAARDPNLFATWYLVEDWDPPSLYHQVFLIDASGRGYVQKVSIISPFVVRLISEGLDRHGGPKIWGEFEMFKKASSHDSGHRIWASHSMSAIVEWETRQAKLHCITRPPDANRVLESTGLTFPLPRPIPYDNMDSWPHELGKVHTYPTLFQPKTRTEGAFGSVLVAQDYTAFFEATVSHHVSDTLPELYGRLDALVGALEAAQMSERLPSESCKWRLVFLVPKKDLEYWMYARSWRENVPKGNWKEHLDLYVFCPGVGMLEVQERPRYKTACGR